MHPCFYVMVEPDSHLEQGSVVTFQGCNVMYDNELPSVVLELGDIVKLDPGKGEAACRRAFIVDVYFQADLYWAEVL